VAQSAGAAGELAVDNLADQLGSHPVRAGGVLARRGDRERVLALFDRFEARNQAGAFGLERVSLGS
jgi:hypothetical protein